jgi:hypothetical protein
MGSMLRSGHSEALATRRTWHDPPTRIGSAAVWMMREGHDIGLGIAMPSTDLGRIVSRIVIPGVGQWVHPVRPNRFAPRAAQMMGEASLSWACQHQGQPARSGTFTVPDFAARSSTIDTP